MVRRSVTSNRLNHPVAVASTPRWTHHLKDVRGRTHVVHGSHDPSHPHQHGRAIVAAIPGAKLRVVEGMGHILAPGSRYWSELADAIVENSCKQ